MSEAITLYEDVSERWGLIEGEALAMLSRLPDNALDAVVTDPPYGLDIVGESWDGADIRRAHGSFERWTSRWAAECLRVLKPGGHLIAFGAPRTVHRLTSGVEDARFEIRDLLFWLHAQGAPKTRKLPGGLATQLKPAYEPILLARKPLVGTTLRNVEQWGTGALNVEAARSGDYWPAPLALSHTQKCERSRCREECPARQIDALRPALRPSRLFFCAKATKAEREAGCDDLPLINEPLYAQPLPRLRRNIHPTVKPIALMRWLVRLAVPVGGIVLDPFAGSGTTGIATLLEGRTFLGIEREARYVDIACARLAHWSREA